MKTNRDMAIKLAAKADKHIASMWHHWLDNNDSGYMILQRAVIQISQEIDALQGFAEFATAQEIADSLQSCYMEWQAVDCSEEVPEELQFHWKRLGIALLNITYTVISLGDLEVPRDPEE